MTYNASQYAHYLASVMNQRRRKVNPLYNTVVIGGFKGAESYLASVDLYGTLIEGNFATSAFANHIAKPVLL